MIDKQLDSIKESFVKYLDQLGISAKSHKNYRSDLNHFTAWAILKIRSFGSYVESLTEIIPFMSHDLVHEYKNYMLENSFPYKTVNRRLSTLRHLSRFLTASQAIDSDFMNDVENVSLTPKTKSSLEPLINEFRASLASEKVSPNTVKNYVSDVRQFITWLEANDQSQSAS